MRKLLLPLALLATAPLAIAQNCFDGDLGTRLQSGLGDWFSTIQPIGFAFPIGATTYTDMYITDHGFVALSNAGVPGAPTIATAYTPTVANLVAGNAKVCALYADIVATGGGEVWIKSTASHCTVTWLNMQNFGYTTPRYNFQLIMYPNGDFRTIFGPGVTNVSTFGVPSDNGICGCSPGNNVIAPASVDLSTVGATTDDTTYELWTVPLSFDLQNNTMLFTRIGPGYAYIPMGAPANCGSIANNGTGCNGLAMSAVYNGGSASTTAVFPSVGNSGLTLRMTGAVVVGLVAFGTSSLPGIPLAVIGMNGCNAYTNLDIGLFSAGPVVGGQSDFLLAIPPNTALTGTFLAAQGVSVGATPAGLIASGGVNITIGYGP